MEKDCFFEKIEKAFSKNLPNVPLFLYESTDSTNERARIYAASEEGGGEAFFIARTQSAGRGRRGRSFLSEEGGLYLSYLMHPDIPAKDSIKLTLFAAVCTAQVIEELTGASAGIKWVNDIFLKGKKIAGILAEGAFDKSGEKFEYAVVGIGINIKKTNFPEELSEIAGDIESLTGVCAEISEFAKRLAEKLSFFEKTAPELYMGEYRRMSLAIGRRVEVIDPAGNYFAKVIDIGDSGELLIETEDGKTKRLISGEISIKCKQ